MGGITSQHDSSSMAIPAMALDPWIDIRQAHIPNVMFIGQPFKGALSGVDKCPCE
jgi:hypothetical protein